MSNIYNSIKGNLGISKGNPESYDVKHQASEIAEKASSIIWWSFEKPLIDEGLSDKIGNLPMKEVTYWQEFLSKLTVSDREEFIKKIDQIKDESELEKLVESYKIKSAIHDATKGIGLNGVKDILDDITPDKDSFEK